MPSTTKQLAQLESNPLSWRLGLFPSYLTDAAGEYINDAPHHAHYWSWLWSIEEGMRPRPFVGIWSRGAAKSTNAELGTVALGARGIRNYGWYVSGTQDQADDHVGTIASMLESRRLATFYPEMGRRKLGKYGSAKSWRRQRLTTASGFTLDAVGLDTAARGAKMDEDRPGFMVFDDIDERHDSVYTVEKKIETITQTLIPAGAEDRSLLFIQNLIHPGSVFSQIADGSADFIATKILSGPVPAIEDFTYATKNNKVVITSGTPTWVGMDLQRCQAEIDDIGITAFNNEAQHDTEAPAGGMFDHIDMAVLRIDYADVPPLTRVVCWVDPAVTKTDRSDSHAVQVDGIAGDTRTGTIYRLFSWEQRATPLESLKVAFIQAATYGAGYVGVETDQGGDTWQSVFREAKALVLGDPATPPNLIPKIKSIRFAEAKAGQGDQPKVARAATMLVDYEMPGLRIRHVIGTHLTLERALSRFPRTKPLDLVDAGYWSWVDLREAPVIAAFNPDAERIAELEARGEVDDPYAAPRHSKIW